MIFTEPILRRLCMGGYVGDFPPFNDYENGDVDAYIEALVGRLKDNKRITVEADFNSYGSGFASYVPIRIGKKDRSDTEIQPRRDGGRSERTRGLLVYVSRLSPYWFFGGNDWTVHYDAQGAWAGGASGFLDLNSYSNYEPARWLSEIAWLKGIFEAFRYRLLTAEELSPRLDFEVSIPTCFASKGNYRVWDCFFYWED